MRIVSNCPLCEEHALHVLEGEDTTLMQCLYCGYATSDKFVGDKEINSEYKKLPEDMKTWAKEHNGRVWIPGILTLPEGMVYTVNDDKKMKWAYAKMVDIPQDDRKNYPVSDGKFYEQKYDIDNQIIYDNFYDCLEHLNEEAKQKRAVVQELKLPKLKKTKNGAE